MNTPNLLWTIEDKAYDAGDIVTAEFNVTDFNNITAYQFAMKFDTSNLEFVGVEFPTTNPLSLTSNLFSWEGKKGYRVGKGEVRHLATFPKGKTLTNGTVVFKYVFKAKEAGILSENLALGTCCLLLPLKPLAYNYRLNLQTLSLAFTSLNEEVELVDEAAIA